MYTICIQNPDSSTQSPCIFVACLNGKTLTKDEVAGKATQNTKFKPLWMFPCKPSVHYHLLTSLKVFLRAGSRLSVFLYILGSSARKLSVSGVCFNSDKQSTVLVTGSFLCPTTKLLTPSIMNLELCFTYLNMLDILLYEPPATVMCYCYSVCDNLLL